jgi:RimJ/RimL family protein N-acetyltransferase
LTVLYGGPDLVEGTVRLHAPDVGAVRHAQTEPDEWGRWLDLAVIDDSILYFSISQDGRLVGEIFVHDIVPHRLEGMLGYHVFDPARRGEGIGRAALTALLDWIVDQTAIRHIFVITRDDNVRSRRLVEGVGFIAIGRAKEDEHRVVYERHFED